MIKFGFQEYAHAEFIPQWQYSSFNREADNTKENGVLTEKDRTELYLKLDTITKPPCVVLDLKHSLRLIEQIQSALRPAFPCILYRDIATRLLSLWHTMHEEVKEKKFAFIPPDKEQFFEQEQLFGTNVYDKFEPARQDIKSAGNCLASDLDTAAVFHLMRVVECGMRILATHVRPRFKLSLEYCDWSGLIRPMSKKLIKIESRRRGPKKTQQFDFYSRCLSDCKAFIETRNRVSHAREPFSNQEAKALFERVKNFMLLIVNL